MKDKLSSIDRGAVLATLKKLATVAILALVMGVLLYGSYVVFGALNAIVYWFAFSLGAFGLMALINVLRQTMFNSVGKFHILLMQVAYNHGYLVEYEDRYDWHPGTRDQVWIDGEWHDVDGQDKLNILGWRPFGLTRYKDDETWSEYRVDSRAKPDGGDITPVERANIAELGPDEYLPLEYRTGNEGWVLDLKKLYTAGVQKIGDIEVLETAEEVTEREQVGIGKLAGHSALLESVAGLVLGALLAIIVNMM